MFTKGEIKGGINWGIWLDIYALLCIKWKMNENPLYNTVFNALLSHKWEGNQKKKKEREREMCIHEILQARLQQYVNGDIPGVQAGFRKARRNKDLIANIRWIIEKAREFQKNIYFCFIDYVKAFDCVDHNKLWKILEREMGKSDLLVS